MCKLSSGAPSAPFSILLHFRSYTLNKPTTWLVSKFKTYGIICKEQLYFLISIPDINNVKNLHSSFKSLKYGIKRIELHMQ